MRVNFIDLQRVHAPYVQTLQRVVSDIVESGRYVGGSVVRGFEVEFARYLGVKHAIGVSSGTDALLAALMVLDIGPGDEVIVPALTFVSPASCVARLGATPVFVDIDAFFGLDPEALEEAITPQTRAIVPVHIYGQCASPRVYQIAQEHDVSVVEDAAQAVGASHLGTMAGAQGLMGCFSFFPTKNLGALGDGGMVVTDDDALAERLRRVCSHGANPKYWHVSLGGNFRLDPIQAAVLSFKLQYLDAANETRSKNAAAYDQALKGAALPQVRLDNVHTYHQYCVRVASRDAVQTALGERGVGTMVYYPSSLPKQPIFRHLDTETPVADQVCSEVLALPIYEGLTVLERDYVISSFNEVVESVANCTIP